VLQCQNIDRIAAIIALGALVVVWFLGTLRAEADLQPYLKQVMPEADRFEKVSSAVFAVYKKQSSDQLLGYVSIGAASGYGGEMKLAVAVDLQGQVTGVTIVEDKETPSFLTRVLNKKVPSAMIGKSYKDAFEIGQDVDGLSGATYTVRAIADAVRRGSRQVAGAKLGVTAPPEPTPSIQFGLAEIVLIGLYGIGLIGRTRRFKITKQARWISMIIGLGLIGFYYNSSLTMTFVNRLLLGFLPEWQTHLYWYLLVGGVLFVFTATNKNPYCDWFCPFGAAQECLGLVGGAQACSPQRFRAALVWTPRVLVWLAIAIALFFQSPGLSSFEIFGTLFSLTGSRFQFALLGLVLVAALFIKRPWCNFLCPIRPVLDFIRLFRNWIGEIWRTIHPKPAV
jgi:Na+-translocating ferredoxin:NAD+ oxidoreductase RnfG subunit